MEILKNLKGFAFVSRIGSIECTALVENHNKYLTVCIYTAPPSISRRTQLSLQLLTPSHAFQVFAQITVLSPWKFRSSESIHINIRRRRENSRNYYNPIINYGSICSCREKNILMSYTRKYFFRFQWRATHFLLIIQLKEIYLSRRT